MTHHDRSFVHRDAIAAEIAIYLERAADFARTDDRDEIILVALKAYVEGAAAVSLAVLGGTMPDFVAPPRRWNMR